LTHIGRWLDDPQLLDLARVAGHLITHEAITADRTLDIVGGSAGAILGLLALYRATGEAAWLESAIACGHPLLTCPHTAAGGHRTWPPLSGRYLAGFSHGAAGIAYSLVRLHRATGELAFLNAASEAIQFEHELYVDGAANWLDRRWRTEDAPATGSSW